MKLDFVTFFIASFATYRVTVLLSRDIGPFGIFEWARGHSKMLKCPYCTSVYVGVLVATLLAIAGYSMPWPMWGILSFGLSASSIVLDRCFTADYLPK